MDAIIQGDIRNLANALPAQSVNCIVSSPPYWGLRDYGTAQWSGGSEDCDHALFLGGNGEASKKQVPSAGTQQYQHRNTCPKCGAKRTDNQIGLEPTPEEYVQTMVEVFRGLWRVLRDDGVLWLNLGDSYAGDKTGNTETNKNPRAVTSTFKKKCPPNLRPKNLVGIPWRVALALQADGWILRSDIIWWKPNCMPESVTDRPTKSHEYIFLLTKNERYYYDGEAIKEPKAESTVNDLRTNGNGHRRDRNYPGQASNGGTNLGGSNEYRNKRTVWEVSTKSYDGAHFATFPPDLIEPCILAGCPEQVCLKCGSPWVRNIEKVSKSLPVSERHGRVGHNGTAPQQSGYFWNGPTTQATDTFEPTCECSAPTRPGVVLDPFFGSGTVGEVCIKNNRQYLGVELNAEYINLAKERLSKARMNAGLDYVVRVGDIEAQQLSLV